MNTPYIGVTDFTTKEQVLKIMDFIPPWVERRLHVGAMMSYKTLNGIPTNTGWEKIWLDEKGLRNLFDDDQEPQIYNVLHYADYPDENGKVHSTYQDVLKARMIAGPGVHAVQLDMIWPNPKILLELKEHYDVEIVLQVSSKAIEYCTKHDLTMREALEMYSPDSIDYVLIDYGMGKGIPFDPAAAITRVEQALELFPQRKIAVAGGLGPNSYKNLKPIFAKYPDISCDAQGQLRASGSAVDPLDMQRVEDYVKGVCSLL